MAVRLNPKQDERTRSAIQTSQIINRLQKFIFSQPETANRKGKAARAVQMTPTQVAAAIALLKKTLPDLQTLQHTGDEDRPLNHSLTIKFVKPVVAISSEDSQIIDAVAEPAQAEDR